MTRRRDTASRSEALPNLPAIAESVPGYEAITVGGIGAPKGTPVEIIDKLNREINAALIDPKFVARFAEFGATPLSGSPAEFRKLIRTFLHMAAGPAALLLRRIYASAGVQRQRSQRLAVREAQL